MVIAPVVAARFAVQEMLDDTERGSNGFGSTGMGVA
jgi:dUTP pyrophosphatase